MTKAGILGFGKMGRIRAEAATACGIEICKIFDVQLPPHPGYPVAASMDEIIDDPQIEAVFICLPNYLIKPATIASLNKKKHVFCEKPPALNAAEVEEVRRAQAAAGTTLMYGFNHRQHGAVRKMKELISGGAYGRVLWMRGRYGKSVDSAYLKGWRAQKKFAGGGILLDQGIHMLDLFLFIGGRPFDEVHAFVSNLYWKMEGIEDNVFAIMRDSRTGLSAQLHSTMTQWRHLFSLEVFLERGYMVLNGLKTGSGTYGDEALVVAKNRSSAPAATWEDEERFVFPVDDSWQAEVEAFVAAMATPGPAQHGSVEDALALMQLVDAIYQNDRYVSPVLHSDLQAHV